MPIPENSSETNGPHIFLASPDLALYLKRKQRGLKLTGLLSGHDDNLEKMIGSGSEERGITEQNPEAPSAREVESSMSSGQYFLPPERNAVFYCDHLLARDPQNSKTQSKSGRRPPVGDRFRGSNAICSNRDLLILYLLACPVCPGSGDRCAALGFRL